MTDNWNENLADDDEQEAAPCKWGNIVIGHACYCHHPDGSRKCPQWRNAEPYEDCKLYGETDFDTPR